MILLALDTSGTTASAALMSEYIIMAESSVTLSDLRGAGRKTHSETLMPMIAGLFEITGAALEDVDYIACTCGPGSFTGLRIGAATAKGLAFAASKPLIAVPTLDALAYTVEGADSTWVVPMIDARRGQAYSAFYFNNKRMTDYMAEPVEDLRKMIIERAEGRPIIYVEPPLKAPTVGAKALTMLESAADESEFSLLYVRKPQAEREKNEREKREREKAEREKEERDFRGSAPP